MRNTLGILCYYLDKRNANEAFADEASEGQPPCKRQRDDTHSSSGPANQAAVHQPGTQPGKQLPATSYQQPGASK